MLKFFKNSLFYSCANIGQMKYIVSMTKERSSKIVNVLIPRTGIALVSCSHVGDTVKMRNSIQIFNCSYGQWLNWNIMTKNLNPSPACLFPANLGGVNGKS